MKWYQISIGTQPSQRWGYSRMGGGGVSTGGNDRRQEKLTYGGDLWAQSFMVMSWKQLRQSWFELTVTSPWSVSVMTVVKLRCGADKRRRQWDSSPTSEGWQYAAISYWWKLPQHWKSTTYSCVDIYQTWQPSGNRAAWLESQEEEEEDDRQPMSSSCNIRWVTLDIRLS